MSFFPAGQGFLAGLAGTVNGNLTVTGQILAADGVVGAPGIAFAADPSNGIRRAGTSDCKLVAAGTDQVTFAVGGVSTGASTPLVVNARFAPAPETVKVANYPATNTDAVIVMNGSGLTLTLPATPGTAQMLFVRNNDVGTLTVARNGNNINGAAVDLTMLAATAAVLSFTASGWFVVG